jgi:hypothetical protein
VTASRTPRKPAPHAVPAITKRAQFLSLPPGGLAELARIAYPDRAEKDLRRQFLEQAWLSPAAVSIDESGCVRDQGEFLITLAVHIHRLERGRSHLIHRFGHERFALLVQKHKSRVGQRKGAQSTKRNAAIWHAEVIKVDAEIREESPNAKLKKSAAARLIEPRLIKLQKDRSDLMTIGKPPKFRTIYNILRKAKP